MPTIHGEHETHYAVSDNIRNNHLKQETPQYTTKNKGAPLHYNSYHENITKKGYFWDKLT